MSDFEKSPILPSNEQNQTLVPQAKTLEDNPIIYKSEMMRQLMKMVERVAPSSATVLFLANQELVKSLLLNKFIKNQIAATNLS